MKYRLKDRLGEIDVRVDEGDDWIFFQRVRVETTDPVVFLGLQLSVLAEFLDWAGNPQ